MTNPELDLAHLRLKQLRALLRAGDIVREGADLSTDDLDAIIDHLEGMIAIRSISLDQFRLLRDADV